MENGPRIDADAWVDRYGDALFHFALARVKSREIAEDLVQETFLAAVKGRERFKGQSSEKTWLFGILKHKVIDHYRRNKTVVFEQDLHPDSDLGSFFNEQGKWDIRPQHWRMHPGKSHEVKEFLDHFYHCLADLPEQTADVFVRREIDGQSTQEICQRLGITNSNCWVILYRARMLLRRCLELAGISPARKKVEG